MLRFPALCALFALSPLASALELKPLDLYQSGFPAGTEIVSVQPASMRVIVTNSAEGLVDILKLDPAGKLTRTDRQQLVQGGAGEITSATFHPTADVYAVCVRDSDGLKAGSVQIRSGADGKLLGSVAVGIWPDSLAFSPNGDFLVVANEGEAYVKEGEGFRSGEGSISVIDLRPGLDKAVHHSVSLPDLTGVAGTVEEAHKRQVERIIDN